MNGNSLLLIIILAIAALTIFGYFISVFNNFIRLRNDVNKAWANIDVLLKQRSAELPKLLSAVKGYMKHEKSLLTELAESRKSLMASHSIKEKVDLDSKISSSLKQLFALAENYPKLMASQNFVKLQERISGLENELTDRREFYNECVNNFNICLQ